MLLCSNLVIRLSPKANNKQYCSLTCRDLADKEKNGAKRKKKMDYYNHKKFNQYAPGKTQCVICEGWYKGVCYHAWQRHNLSAVEYKKLVGKDISKSIITKELKRRKRSAVIKNYDKIVPNNLIKKGEATRFKKGDSRNGVFERSPETLERLKARFKIINEKRKNNKVIRTSK